MARERIDERLTRNALRRLTQGGDQLRDRDHEPDADAPHGPGEHESLPVAIARSRRPISMLV